MNINIMEIIQ
jgi:hypothetical protein